MRQSASYVVGWQHVCDCPGHGQLPVVVGEQLVPLGDTVELPRFEGMPCPRCGHLSRQTLAKVIYREVVDSPH